MAREVSANNEEYRDRLLKLIPSEFVGVHLLGLSIIPADDWRALAGLDVLLVFVMPLYLWKVSGVRRKGQIAVTTISFVVWVYSVPGGPFDNLGWYVAWAAGVILAVWTAILAPIFIVKSPPAAV